MPKDAEHVSESELIGEGGIGTWKLSLGWWIEGEGRRFGVDVGMAEKARWNHYLCNEWKCTKLGDPGS